MEPKEKELYIRDKARKHIPEDNEKIAWSIHAIIKSGKMIGRQEKSKIKKCPLCGGHMYDGITIAPFFISNRIIVIRDVPAEICDNCGEAYTKSSVVSKIETLLDKLEALDSEVSVLHYKTA
jgi:YgiT-type zinc finger domain-containing protein